ncbi:MAG: redoxin domain-containing protein [Reichenbachiella sp.]
MNIRILRLIGVLFLIIFCVNHETLGQEKPSYNIEIEVAGLTDSIAYLGFHFGEKKYLQDTSQVVNGRVVFQSEKDLKTGLYFLYGKGLYLEFVVDETDFTLKTSTTDSYGNMEVKNSPSNELFRDFQLMMVNHQNQLKEITGKLDSTSIKEDSVATFNEIKLLNERNRIDRDSMELVANETYVGQILKMMNLNPELRFKGDSLSVEQKRDQYNAYRKTYFDELNFNSEGLLRSPIFHAKLIEYVDKVTFQNPDSIIVSIDELMIKSKDNEELYRYILSVMFQRYQNPKIMGMDKVFVYLGQEYYLGGKATWADEKMLKELKDELVFHVENQIGLKAPQIYMQDTSNVQSDLYGINADYLILYFYSPTCGHCKKKTPVLKDVYDRLDGKIEVAAVCTDTDADKWKKFIRDLDLNWLNYADMGYKSNFRTQYNVRSTPVLYVLDKDKKIIAKKLDVEQVEKFIEDQIRLSEMTKS